MQLLCGQIVFAQVVPNTSRVSNTNHLILPLTKLLHFFKNDSKKQKQKKKRERERERIVTDRHLVYECSS